MDANPRATFTKRAGDGRAVHHLRHEAQVLEAARHPGVVELLSFEDSGAAALLVTARADGSDLTSHPALSLEEAAGVLAGVAATLADLHDAGVVHGAITPEHVLVAADGRPVLCGLGCGGRTGQVPPRRPEVPDEFADPARAPTDPLGPAADVFGLGALVTWLLRNGPPAKPTRALLKLRALAARAASADGDRRPSARDVAASITAAVPQRRLPGPRPSGGAEGRHPGPSGHRRRAEVRRNRRRPPVLTVVAGAGVGILLGGAFLLEAARPTEPAPPERTDVLAPAVTSTAVPFPSPSADADPPAPAPAGCPPTAGPLSADVDGDRCPEDLRWADGVLQGGSARWAVGRPGDQVATADWRCTGMSTLALLRPETGDIFVFDTWAAPGGQIAARATARIDGAFALREADLDGDLCPELVVERRGGPPATVNPR